ncbi:hypothetical protein BpHYR1_045861 [Brachionus plicatilis]|uniref:Uncharacterized protein n=1 Tax=Brachionus plicatilis TaxID=10195 RepID=A0A3M7QJP6_BRAPC|nr:hypothetical protein BpHYR1_045861 [Brachionus plicatilis]
MITLTFKQIVTIKTDNAANMAFSHSDCVSKKAKIILQCLNLILSERKSIPKPIEVRLNSELKALRAFCKIKLLI